MPRDTTYPTPYARPEFSGLNDVFDYFRNLGARFGASCRRWGVFLATFDLDQLRRLEVPPQGEVSAAQWNWQMRQGGPARGHHIKLIRLTRGFKQVYATGVPQQLAYAVDSYGQPQGQ